MFERFLRSDRRGSSNDSPKRRNFYQEQDAYETYLKQEIERHRGETQRITVMQQGMQYYQYEDGKILTIEEIPERFIIVGKNINGDNEINIIKPVDKDYLRMNPNRVWAKSDINYNLFSINYNEQVSLFIKRRFKSESENGECTAGLALSYLKHCRYRYDIGGFEKFKICEIPSEFLLDRDFVMEAVKIEDNVLGLCTEFQDDREVVMEAVKAFGTALGFASPRLQGDKEIVLEAYKQNPGSLVFATLELQKYFRENSIFQIESEVYSEEKLAAILNEKINTLIKLNADLEAITQRISEIYEEISEKERLLHKKTDIENEINHMMKK